jgi:hypothetical protein
MEANIAGGLWCAFLEYLLSVSYHHFKVTEVLSLNVILPNIHLIWVGRRYVSLEPCFPGHLIAL